jgi:DNA polymerase elongation subunit (family B)
MTNILLGGHHIKAKYEKIRGPIVCRDFSSQYPFIIVMHKLLPEHFLKHYHKLLIERIRAKKAGEKDKAFALKIVINAIYGTMGCEYYKNIYNLDAANTCTRLGREYLRRYAKTLDVAGFEVLYGATDSCYVGLPKGLTEEDLDLLTDYYATILKKEAINPVDDFKIGIDGKYKFMWFIDKKDNRYLTIDNDNKINLTGGLIDIRAPEVISKLFEGYISDKIIKELDVNFKEEEITNKLKELLNNNLELATIGFNVKDKSEYKSESNQNCQISMKYGAGYRKLLPNNAGIGAGVGDIKMCTLEEFKSNNLKFDNLDIERLKRYLAPFYSTKEKVFDLEQQTP